MKIRWSKWIAIALGVLADISAVAMRRFEVTGESMEPTLSDGDWLVCDALSPRLGLVRRGEIVIVELPGDRENGAESNDRTDRKRKRFAIKRLVGVEGDSVVFRGRLTELGEGEIFVTGDNPSESRDGREWGPLPTSSVTAVARFRYRSRGTNRP